MQNIISNHSKSFLLEFRINLKVKEIAFEPKAVVTELDPVVVYSNGQTRQLLDHQILQFMQKNVKRYFLLYRKRSF